jgi:hypothetical protein
VLSSPTEWFLAGADSASAAPLDAAPPVEITIELEPADRDAWPSDVWIRLTIGQRKRRAEEPDRRQRLLHAGADGLGGSGQLHLGS